MPVTRVRDGYRLDQALPADVVTRSAGGLMSYRNFPVFSAPWFWRRALLFGVIFGLFFVLVVIGVLLASHDLALALVTGTMTFVAFMVMACAGPGAATWVRHRGWTMRAERVGVVFALLFGVVVSYGIDATVSERIEKTYIEPRMKATGALTEEMIARRPKPTPAMLAVNLAFLAAIYAMLGGALALRAYLGEKQRWLESLRAGELTELRARQQSAELRLGVLQAQIEPHFLFNTLASLRALVRQDPARAEATIDALVDHLRATIPKLRSSDGALASTLAQQFEICRSYLALMQVRMGDRLSFSIDLPDDLRDAPFPPLMLISLVENAIKHGLEPKSGPGHVRLSAVRTHAPEVPVLRVEIADDGVGLRDGAGSGLGLANIRDQLQTRYQGQARIDIVGLPGGGTRAVIAVPEASP